MLPSYTSLNHKYTNICHKQQLPGERQFAVNGSLRFSHPTRSYSALIMCSFTVKPKMQQ